MLEGNKVPDLTKEEAEQIQSEMKEFMKRVLDIGQSSFSNNKQYHAFRKLIFEQYHQHDKKISIILDLPINKVTDGG